MTKLFIKIPKRIQFTLASILLLIIVLSAYLIGYSIDNRKMADSCEAQKESTVCKNTLSPNNPIHDVGGENKNTESGQNNSAAKVTNSKIPFFRASIPYWDQEAAFNSFKQNVAVFSFVTVFWYNLDSNGAIQKYTYAVEDPQIINFSHANGVKIFGLIANLPEDGDWDSDRVNKVISTKSARSNHIAEIVALAERMNFDGISIDYEELETSQKDNFTQFIKELAAALHKKGKLLGVAIHPKSGEGKPTEDNGSAAQDLAPISQAADQLYFMTYGEHWDESAAGPIASLSWVRNVINYALSIGVPREKIFMGTPLYGLDWSKKSSSYGTATGLTYSEVANLINQYKPTLTIDTAEGTATFSYQTKGKTHEVWFENNQTIQTKLEFAKSLGISATFWRLGGEDPLVWAVVSKFH